MSPSSYAATSAGEALASDDLANRRAALEKSDDDLRNALADANGERHGRIWQRAAHADPRVLRAGTHPRPARTRSDLLAHDAPRIGGGPRHALDIASSGDLGYTIGGDANCAACGTYYRIWRWHDGSWRVLVDLSRATAR